MPGVQELYRFHSPQPVFKTLLSYSRHCTAIPYTGKLFHSLLISTIDFPANPCPLLMTHTVFSYSLQIIQQTCGNNIHCLDIKNTLQIHHTLSTYSRHCLAMPYNVYIFHNTVRISTDFPGT